MKMYPKPPLCKRLFDFLQQSKNWIAISLFCTPFVLLESSSTDNFSLNRKQIYLGPTVFNARRTKSGGVQQDGTINGFRIGFERFKRYGWYIGAEGYYARGNLHGHSATKASLFSKFKDCYGEGRFGYTFQKKYGCMWSFTPFICGGYVLEKNSYYQPSPFKVDFTTKFSYAGAGVITWIYLWDLFELGFNFKMRYPIDPQCKIGHGENHGSLKQNVEQRLQYFVEAPITLRIGWDGKLALGLVPFFESRLYGSHPNYPFNYVKTRLRYYGATLRFEYRW